MRLKAKDLGFGSELHVTLFKRGISPVIYAKVLETAYSGMENRCLIYAEDASPPPYGMLDIKKRFDRLFVKLLPFYSISIFSFLGGYLTMGFSKNSCSLRINIKGHTNPCDRMLIGLAPFICSIKSIMDVLEL